MSKLIDADKVKEAISEKTVATRKTERNWYKNALEMMELVDNQPAVLLSCPKCHGRVLYKFRSIGEAARELFGIVGPSPVRTAISRCCLGHLNTTHGYKWRYDNA